MAFGYPAAEFSAGGFIYFLPPPRRVTQPLVPETPADPNVLERHDLAIPCRADPV
jgi:hypothetical protein